LTEYLQRVYSFSPDFIAENTIKGEIKGIIVDCIAHQFQWLGKNDSFDGLKLAGYKDIAAMKLNAISGNGTRLKDFIDVAFLSSKLSFNEMLLAYQDKYRSNSVIAIKSVVYFDDINFDEPIMMMGEETLQWKKIERRLTDMVKFPNKVFPRM
jgi:hypothetical protein